MPNHPDAPEPRTVAVTGASGLIGRALVQFLHTTGHQVLALVRRPPRAGEIRWDPAAGQIDGAALEGVDAVVHLAGENIAEGRWTGARKRKIEQSRVQGTRLLAATLAGLARKPRVLVSASAIGIYGDGGDRLLTEDAAPGSGFLAELGSRWEAATTPAREAGIRVVLLRFGIVLTADGGALGKMLPVFRLGLGGPLGSGRQWMSWITLDDCIRIIHFALTTPALEGPVNAVAPGPVTNTDFTAALAEALQRPALLAVPGFALELRFGELAREALLAGQRVRPTRLEALGFEFRDPDLRPALTRLLAAD